MPAVCFVPVRDRSVTERSCSTITPWGPRSGYSSLLQPYQPLSFCLYLSLSNFLSSSLLSLSLYLLILPSLSLPLSFSCCLSLSPPPPLFSPYLSLYGKAVNSLAPLLRHPALLSLYLSLSAFRRLCKLSNLVADKLINTTLASFNTHHSALCIFLLPLLLGALYQT